MDEIENINQKTILLCRSILNISRFKNLIRYMVTTSVPIPDKDAKYI